jgi:hypothetical protein
MVPVQELAQLAVVREVAAFARSDVGYLGPPGGVGRLILGPQAQDEDVVAGLAGSLSHFILSISNVLGSKDEPSMRVSRTRRPRNVHSSNDPLRGVGDGRF